MTTFRAVLLSVSALLSFTVQAQNPVCYEGTKTQFWRHRVKEKSGGSCAITRSIKRSGVTSWEVLDSDCAHAITTFAVFSLEDRRMSGDISIHFPTPSSHSAVVNLKSTSPTRPISYTYSTYRNEFVGDSELYWTCVGLK